MPRHSKLLLLLYCLISLGIIYIYVAPPFTAPVTIISQSPILREEVRRGPVDVFAGAVICIYILGLVVTKIAFKDIRKITIAVKITILSFCLGAAVAAFWHFALSGTSDSIVQAAHHRGQAVGMLSLGWVVALFNHFLWMRNIDSRVRE